eukprot:SM000134S26970  [mRNA]  locus=s134:402074:405404:- [translate_table: standard]
MPPSQLPAWALRTMQYPVRPLPGATHGTDAEGLLRRGKAALTLASPRPACAGAVVKPGKPIRQVPTEGVGSQLHLSQATLGRNVSAGARTVVKARVGDGPTIWLCSLTGGSQESVSLDLLFDQDVTFAISGKASVHLTGYYIPNALEDYDEESDEYEESEDDDDDADEYEDEDELLEAGDDDEDEEEDDEMPEAVPLESNVVIQEVTEEEAVLLKDGKVQDSYSYQVETSVQPIIEEKEASLQEGQGTDEAAKPGEREAAEEAEEEDEDGFLLVKKTTDVIEVEVTQPSKKRAVASEENKPVQSTERTSSMNVEKQEAVTEGETTTETETAPSTSEGVAEAATQAASQAPTQPLGKKKRKAERSKGRVQGDEEVKAATEQESAPQLARPSTTATEKTPEKANGGNETQVKTPENTAAATTAEERTPDMAREEAKPKSTKKRAPAVRRFPNGMEVEESALGKPDGRAAKMGKTVLMHYTGRLKSTGKIFDSNLAPQKPFAFRLGVGEVIKGWDVGVQDMKQKGLRQTFLGMPGSSLMWNLLVSSES